MVTETTSVENTHIDHMQQAALARAVYDETYPDVSIQISESPEQARINIENYFRQQEEQAEAQAEKREKLMKDLEELNDDIAKFEDECVNYCLTNDPVEARRVYQMLSKEIDNADQLLFSDKISFEDIAKELPIVIGQNKEMVDELTQELEAINQLATALPKVLTSTVEDFVKDAQNSINVYIDSGSQILDTIPLKFKELAKSTVGNALVTIPDIQLEIQAGIDYYLEAQQQYYLLPLQVEKDLRPKFTDGVTDILHKSEKLAKKIENIPQKFDNLLDDAKQQLKIILKFINDIPGHIKDLPEKLVQFARNKIQEAESEVIGPITSSVKTLERVKQQLAEYYDQLYAQYEQAQRQDAEQAASGSAAATEQLTEQQKIENKEEKTEDTKETKATTTINEQPQYQTTNMNYSVQYNVDNRNDNKTDTDEVTKE